MTNGPIGPKLLPAVQVRNMIERMVRSGALCGEKADAWKTKLSQLGALNELRQKAEAGDTGAIGVLMGMYVNGTGGAEKNVEEAVRWAVRGGELGHMGLLGCAGQAYLLGQGCEKQPALGVCMLTEAACAGDGDACCVLGDLFRRGRAGLAANPKAATKWFGRALADEHWVQHAGRKQPTMLDAALNWVQDHPP